MFVLGTASSNAACSRRHANVTVLVGLQRDQVYGDSVCSPNPTDSEKRLAYICTTSAARESRRSLFQGDDDDDWNDSNLGSICAPLLLFGLVISVNEKETCLPILAKNRNSNEKFSSAALIFHSVRVKCLF